MEGKKVYNSPMPPRQWMFHELIDLIAEQARQRDSWALLDVTMGVESHDGAVDLMFFGTESTRDGLVPVQIRATVRIEVDHVVPAKWARDQYGQQ